jgi:hypothetical protein
MGSRIKIAMCVPDLASRMRRHKIFKILLGYQVIILFQQMII